VGEQRKKMIRVRSCRNCPNRRTDCCRARASNSTNSEPSDSNSCRRYRVLLARSIRRKIRRYKIRRARPDCWKAA
jgi:hypothetical protein